MYNLKAFYGFPGLVSNVPDTVAKLGEISDDSLTYAKDKTYHTSADAPNVICISFHSVKDETVVDVPSSIKNQVLSLGSYIYSQAMSGTITNNGESFRQMVLAEFNGIITDFTLGDMVTNGNQWMPEWVSFTVVDAVETTNNCLIWLSDESFSSQYDEYIVNVVHPFTTFDDFFKAPAVVKEALAAYDIVEKMEEAQTERGQYPTTYLKAFEFDYVNPQNTTDRTKATWLVLIWGEAGNNPDLIKDQIASELIAGSTHTREEWEVILPDLFMTTEFIFTPFEDQYSVPNRDFRAGIYSPTVDPRKRAALLRRTARGPGYTDVWVDNNYEISANIYKSVAFGVVGNPQNRGGVTQFSAQFPDYLILENDSADSNRISAATLEWMIKFSALLKAAETMTQLSSVPKGISRQVRDGVVYASAYHKNINYLVVSKDSVESLG